MTCRSLSLPNAQDYCVTCSRYDGMPPVCTINRADPGFFETVKKPRYTKKKPLRGIPGKVAARRKRAINTMIEKKKASSWIAYYPIDEAIERAGI